MANAEWAVRKFAPPPGLAAVITDAGKLAEEVATFLDTVSAALDAAAVVAQGGFDLYRTLVNAFISAVENFLADLKNSGVYVLVDYPQNLNVMDFHPLSDANLAGTLLDPEALGIIVDDAGDTSNRLQAVATKRRRWNPVSENLISYDTAVARIAGAFDDPVDPMRPLFSDDAATVGIVIMVHSEELGAYLRLVRAIGSIFAIEDVRQSLLMPGFGTWFADVGKRWDELNQADLALLDLAPPLEFRDSGKHPNFIYNVKLGELVPVLGSIINALSALVEQFRPNDDITKFIQAIIDGIKAKVERIRAIRDELQKLADDLQGLLAGSKFATCVVKSNTGNNGFKLGLINSTGHPEFDGALVLSVVLYAGGPSARALEALFGAPGEAVVKSHLAAIENEKKHLTRPILQP